MDKLIQSYFSMIPLRTINFEDFGSVLIDERHQKSFEIKALKSNHATTFGVSKKYSRGFLKNLIDHIECSGNEVIEELYTAYLSLLDNQLCDDFCFKTYCLPHGHKIVMKEATQMLSSGTTGLISWQAAFMMCEWVFCHAGIFSGKKVLELGCGNGLLGVFICKLLHPRAYLLSDWHEKVLHLLRNNLKINNINLDEENADTLMDEIHLKERRTIAADSDEASGNCEIEQCETRNQESTVQDCDCCKIVYSCEDAMRRPAVQIHKIDWMDFQCPKCLQGQESDDDIDVIVGTDLVFDTAVIPFLVRVLAFFLRKSKVAKAFISTTIRNEETYSCFINCLRKENLEWVSRTNLQPDLQQLFVYDKSANIEILEISSSDHSQCSDRG